MVKAIVLVSVLFLFFSLDSVPGASADYLLSEGFEGPGFENSGWIKFGDPDEDFSGIALQGQQSLNCVGHQQIFRNFSASNSFNLYMKMRFTTIPSFQGLLFWRNSSVNTVAEMYMNNGSVELIHGHVIHTSASIFTTNITYDVWIEWTKGSGADGTMKLFVATDGNKPPTPQLEITDGNGGEISRFELGPEGFGGNIIFDHLLYAENPIGSSPEGNAPPLISQIPQQTITPDSTTGPLPFIVTDYETPPDALVVTASSSNPTLVPDTGIVLGGSDSNRTVTVTPAVGQQGNAVIQITVSDGKDTASISFTVVVASTNSNHTFLLSEGFEGTGFENSGWTKLGTPDEDYDVLPLQGSHSLHTEGAQRIMHSFSPYDSLSFYVKVRFIALPTFQSLLDWEQGDTDLRVIAEMYLNAGLVTLGDGTARGLGSTVLTTNTTYDIWIDWTKGRGADGTMQLFIATDGIKPPVPEVNIANGNSGPLGRISIGPALSGDVIFDRLLIDNLPIGNQPAGDDHKAPSISRIENQTILGNSSSAPIAFTVRDDETPADSLILAGLSSNSTLIPDANITFGGSGTNRTVTLTPAMDQYGSATILLVVSDGVLTSSNSFLVTVTAGEITVTVNDASRLYGAANPTFAGSISGLHPGDSISLSLDSPATPESPIGNYPIVMALNDPEDKLGRYTVITNNGSLTVTRAPLEVIADNKSRSYGATNPAFTGTILGIQNADDLTLSFSCSATVSSPVGSYEIVPTVNDPGNRLGNYFVTINGATLTVRPAGITGITIVGNQAHILGSADVGVVLKIEASSDLISWSEVASVTGAADGSFEFVDSDTVTLMTRFYRAVAP